MQNMCFISTNKQLYVNNRHVNKQLVNSENWSFILKCYNIFIIAQNHKSPV